MKAFVEFYHHGAVSGELIPVCGDRGIVILDGRWSDARLIQEARDANGWHRPLYPGFKVHRGDLHQSRCIFASF